MEAQLARPRKALEDLQALPEDVRAELIDGEIYLMPAPGRAHLEATGAVYVALRTHAGGAAGGRVAIAPFDVRLPSGEIVQPDVLWVAPSRTAIFGDWVDGAPDLVVEVLSPSNPERDRIVKRDLYERSGVREYWIVDPAVQSIEILLHEGVRYRPAGYLRPGNRFVSPCLPGLALRVEDVFPPL